MRLLTKLAILGIFMLCMACVSWVVYGYVAASQVPDIPVYPGARNVQKVIDHNGIETSDGPVLGLITYETPASAKEVLTYYKDTLERKGWKNDWCCKELYRFERYGRNHSFSYQAWIYAEETESGQTNVRIEVRYGAVACDCFP